MRSPVVLVLALLLGACSGQPVEPSPEDLATATSVATSTPSPAASEAAEWVEPRDYSFTLASECGERDLVGRFHVEVANGVVVGVEGLDEPGRRYVANRTSDGGVVGGIPTLAGLLRTVTEARAQGADEVSVTTDPADGRPVSIEIDWVVGGIDDEECYTISDFVGPTG